MNSAIINIIRNLIHEKFLCILAGVFLQFIAFENSDVVGQADVEPTYAFHAAYISGEIPDVVVALMRRNKLLGPRIFLDEQILGHQVKLQRDTCGGIAAHVEYIYLDFMMFGGMLPGLIVENLDIADTVDVENADATFLYIVADYEAIFWFDVISFYVPITYSATIVRSILMEDNASLLGEGML